MHISELVGRSHALARSKGFWEDEDTNVPAKLMLIVSEVAEALEAYRERGTETFIAADGQKPEGLGVELADAVIRICDLCGALGIDLADLIERKHIYNMSRPYKHGKRF